jgi:hypothetical protein
MEPEGSSSSYCFKIQLSSFVYERAEKCKRNRARAQREKNNEVPMNIDAYKSTKENV